MSHEELQAEDGPMECRHFVFNMLYRHSFRTSIQTIWNCHVSSPKGIGESVEITSDKWASQEPQIRRRVSIRDVDGVVDVLLLEQAYDD